MDKLKTDDNFSQYTIGANMPCTKILEVSLPKSQVFEVFQWILSSFPCNHALEIVLFDTLATLSFKIIM